MTIACQPELHDFNDRSLCARCSGVLRPTAGNPRCGEVIATLHFPEGEPVGYLEILSARGSATHFGPATGTVSVPDDAQMGFVLDTDGPHSLAFLRNMLPDAFYAVSVFNGFLTADDVGALTGLTELRDLRIVGTPLAERLHSLAKLTRLRTLWLMGDALHDADLTFLWMMPELERLSLSGNPISDKGCAAIRNMTALQELRLAPTNVTSDGLVFLSNLTSLERLNLAGTKVDGSILEHIPYLPNLRYLQISEDTADPETLRRARQRYPHVQIVTRPRSTGGEVSPPPSPYTGNTIYLRIRQKDAGALFGYLLLGVLGMIHTEEVDVNAAFVLSETSTWMPVRGLIPRELIAVMKRCDELSWMHDLHGGRQFDDTMDELIARVNKVVVDLLHQNLQFGMQVTRGDEEPLW